MNSTSNIKRENIFFISAFKSPKSGGVTAEKAAKPVTAVEDCVVTFGIVKPLDIKYFLQRT